MIIEFLQKYWVWYLEQLEFVKFTILPVVIGAVIAWYLSKKDEKKS
jgi:hypothetical protein